jgi:3-methyladenine DNA glycosylase AlkD
MWHEGLFEALESMRDPEYAARMASYMRNQFPFLGIKAGSRREACKTYFVKAKKEKIVDFDFVDKCFAKEEREFHLAAVDYLSAIKELLGPDDLPKLKRIILTRSWWDTVDGLVKVVGSVVFRNPEMKAVMLEWSLDDSIWVRRIAILHQGFKDKTDRLLLAAIIENNMNQKEFFINKAIGWSLREYSKTNSEWVRGFIQAHKEDMANLSIKEGSKYI